MTAYSMLYKFYGDKYGVDPLLLRAIAKVESAENPLAVGPSGDLGLMQINPRANFQSIDGYPANDYDYFNPAWSIKVAAQVLEWNIRSYGLKRGIAIYNMWSARRSPIDGPFPNQSYVDKVYKYYG